MKPGAIYRFVDRDLPGLIDWLVRFAEILLLAAVFAFAATRTDSWLLWGFASLLLAASFAHVWLAIHAMAKRLDPDGLKRLAAGKKSDPVSKAAAVVSLSLGMLVGSAVGALAVWAIYRMVMSNSL